MSRYSGDPGYQAFRMLQAAFVILPILAGLDKFLNLLTYWPSYLSPLALQTVQGDGVLLMAAIGVVEIVAGLGVLCKPRVFAYLISLWLFVIILTLILSGQYYDVALRDFALFLSALALGRLSLKYTR